MLKRLFRWGRDLAAVCLCCGCVYALPPGFPGANVGSFQRLGPQMLPEPAFKDSAPESELISPRVLPTVDLDRLSTKLRVFVGKFVFTGNHVFSDEQLSEITSAYENRIITSAELQEVREKISRHYIEHGHINSGAVIPDQEVVDGTVTLQIVEGVLSSLEVSGNYYLNSDYIRERLLLGTGPPLKLGDLQRHVQLLHRNPIIKRINAELAPGNRRGESHLRVLVEEERPYQLMLEIDNQRPPSIGAHQYALSGHHGSLTGRGDMLSGRLSTTKGLGDLSLSYTLPLDARDTLLGVKFEKSRSFVVEKPFDAVDIRSESKSFGLNISRPIIRSKSDQLSLDLGLERRRSKTFLLGFPFSFSAGARNGQSSVTALRFSQSWLRQSRVQAVAVKSVFNLGIDALGATINPEGPDGRFFTWLGQFQWARRLGKEGHQVIFRGGMQLSADSLLPMEKFVIGGADTVRGYRENLLVRDNGLVVSMEYRIPFFKGDRETPRLWLAPFFDYGRAWDKFGETPNPRSISSAGVGLRWDPHRQIHAELYLAAALRNIDRGDLEHDLQDSGIHFRFNYRLF